MLPLPAGTVDEVFSFLVGRLESSMRELLGTDLALYPTEKWKQQGWDFIDSLDPKREWEGFSYVDMPDPLKGQEVSFLTRNSTAVIQKDCEVLEVCFFGVCESLLCIWGWQ